MKSVYLVGRQTVDDADIDRFLADPGVSWQFDTTSFDIRGQSGEDDNV
jgi:hypothetical protein